MKGWKKIFHANRDQKKAGVVILISDKIGFKTKAMKRDKEGHYIMIKGSIQGEDITTINIYAPNIGAPQYVRQMLTSMKAEINSNTIIVGDNTPLTPMDRSTKQKINKETQTLNDTIDQGCQVQEGSERDRGSVVSDSLPPHGLYLARILCARDFPGKSTGVGCHCLLRSPFILVSICLTYCGAPMLGAYMFIIVISSSWIHPLIIM